MKSIFLQSLLLGFSLIANGQIISKEIQGDTNEITVSSRNVTREQFNTGEINSPLELITGKVPGLSIVRPGSNPSSGFDIRLRGLTTVNGNISPLIVVDDLVGADIDNVNPEEIESVSVISSGAALMYGASATPGAIVIKTKQGRVGKPLIEYHGRTSIDLLSRSTGLMDASQWRSFSTLVHSGTDYKSSTDWIRELTQTAISHVHSLGVSGGTKNTTFRISSEYNNTKGIMAGTGYAEINGRASLHQTMFDGRLRLDLHGGITDKNSNFGFPQAFKYASIYNPTAPVKSSDPAYSRYRGYFQLVSFDTYNPVAINDLNSNEGRNRAADYSVRGTLQVFKGLKFSAVYSLLGNRNLGNQVFDSTDLWGQWHLQSRQYNRFSKRRTEISLGYTKSFRTVSVHAFADYTRMKINNDMIASKATRYMNADLSFKDIEAGFVLKNGTNNSEKYISRNSDISYSGGLVIDLARSILVTAGARYEGSSLFGMGNKWFLSESTGLKADIGRLFRIGNPQTFLFHANYSLSGNYLPYFGILGNRSSAWFYNGNYDMKKTITSSNADLEWEKRHDLEAGFGFSHSNLKVSADYYRIITEDLYFEGFAGIINNLPVPGYINMGKLRSSGFELTLSLYDLVKNSAFEYDINFNSWFRLNNDFLSTKADINGATVRYGSLVYGDMGMPGQNQVPTTLIEEGCPAGQLYSWKYQEINSSGYPVYADINKDGKLDQADRVVTGNGLPRLQVGLDNYVKYKKWDIAVSFLAVAGHDLINSFRALYEVPQMISYYNVPESTVNVRNVQNGGYSVNTSGMLTDYHIEKGSYISLNNISVGYTFAGKGQSEDKNLQLYFSANHLFYITKYKGSDPQPRYSDVLPENEYNPLVTGIDRLYEWPVTRSFSLGVNVQF